MKPPVITSVSWIDRKNLPTPGLLNLLEAAIGHSIGWDDRTVIGLIATCNPTPPEQLADLDAFRANKQYRAIASMTLSPSLDGFDRDPLFDPGWTPPFDKAKLPWAARAKSPPVKALVPHAGERSPQSCATLGALPSLSTFKLAANTPALAHMMIKFRAGEATNKLGLEEAHSPFHVPWVWCETALARVHGRLKLLCRGSLFPSHAWYVNGKRVAMTLQAPVHAKPDEPALSTGRDASLVRLAPEADRNAGEVTQHPYTVAAGLARTIDLHWGP